MIGESMTPKIKRAIILAYLATLAVVFAGSPSASAADSAGGKLPRVLIIGDSISQSDTLGYTAPTTEALRGQAVLVHHPGNGLDTRNGMKMLKSWLGDEPYDVIHFNWGLHDIKDQG